MIGYALYRFQDFSQGVSHPPVDQLIHVQGNHDLFQILHGLERILEAGDGRHASKAEKERVVIQEAGHIAF